MEVKRSAQKAESKKVANWLQQLTTQVAEFIHDLDVFQVTASAGFGQRGGCR